MSSGGGSAPSPDPQIGQAALQNVQLGKDAFDFFKQEYTNAKPAQDKLNAIAAQVQEQLLQSGKINNEIAADYQNYMQEVFRPLEKSIVDNANSYDTAGRREQEAAAGLADVTQAFDAQREKTNRNNERMGINPNSGNAAALNQQLDVAEAVSGANAMNKGRKSAETMGTALKMDAASLGRNLPSNQATSQQIANNSATSAVNTGLSTMANDRAQTGLMQSGYSNAMQGNSSAANILTNQYQVQSNAYQQQQANDAQGWAGLGTLAGVAMMASDENVKKDITPYSDDQALDGIKKLEISKWKYDDEKISGADDREHIGAMAQDMNKNLGYEVSDGKQVDIISALGLSMAATKALAKKVDRLAEVKEGAGLDSLSKKHLNRADGGTVSMKALLTEGVKTAPATGSEEWRQEHEARGANDKADAWQEGNDRFGEYGKGNISLNNRKLYVYPDEANSGSYSSLESMGINVDGKEVLIPKIVDGKLLEDEEAINHFYKTGEYLGQFDSPEEANKYAIDVERRQHSYYENGPGRKILDESMALRRKNGGPIFSGTGSVKGKGTSTSDSIDAKLSTGEFVLNAEATQMIGLDTLNSINKAGLKKREGVAA